MSRLRLGGAVAAAVGGGLALNSNGFDPWAWLALVGFGLALVAEISLIVDQPERDWYAGRALAESAKTLAWRYAVGGDPFSMDLEDHQARQLMNQRFTEVAAKGKDRITLGSSDPDITEAMRQLRGSSFEERRAAYIKGRTADQRDWYTRKAQLNKKNALKWRILLITAEVVALVLAGGRAFNAWEIDWSGILAALITAGAAWMGLKQYSSLASAYSIAAAELALQASRLQDVAENAWAEAVADAEEAISREHTMWLASRSQVSIV
jgi:hypothetical protein